MDTARPYYQAYEDRYRQIHRAGLQWASDQPSGIVAQTLAGLGLPPTARLLEIGCGEGRDAAFLLERGYDLLATDVSAEAVDYCRQKFPHYAARFRVLDCLREHLTERFDFIYAVAVAHMLVPDADRAAFYRFIRAHLAPAGTALICTMGDGTIETCSDIRSAFTLQARVHEGTGRTVQVAGTSCRMVGFETLERELAENGLTVRQRGLTAVEPDFPQMMYAVAQRRDAPAAGPQE